MEVQVVEIMKNFKINLNKNIVKLLNEYSSSLSLDSDGVLSSFINSRIENNKIIYDFKIIYGNNVGCKIFEICVLDLIGNVSLTVFYFKDTETFYIKDTELNR
jgi:hypothetical protein